MSISSRVSIEDIARAAGVSRSTVSRVINNDANVKAATRQLVLDFVERLNYHPNHAARALVTQRSHVIGVVMPGTANVFFGDNSYFPMLLQGIAEATNRNDHSMLLCLGYSDEDREHFSDRVLRNSMCDGLIIASIENDDPLIARMLKFGRPWVMVERPQQFTDDINYVTVDNIGGARMATEHLISLGYRRIAHISGHLNIGDGQDRLNGYRQALEAADIPYDPELVYHGFFNRASGYAGMKALLPHRPDAVFVASDTETRGALQALGEVGVRVPEDIALIGFDDLDVATESDPLLSTIRQPVQQKGATAFSLLLDLMNGAKQSPQHVVLPTQIVIRNTCGAKKPSKEVVKEVRLPSQAGIP